MSGAVDSLHMELPPRHRAPWTDEDLARVTDLLRGGRSNREIAEAIGRTEYTTAVMLYRLGLNRGSSQCSHCRRPLEQPAVGRKRRFCDENCRTAMERERNRADREATLDPTRPCLHCGRPVTVDRQRNGAMYCSRSCSQAAWYARKSTTADTRDLGVAGPGPEQPER